jgi:hypothetical protein
MRKTDTIARIRPEPFFPALTGAAAATGPDAAARCRR